MGNAFKNLPVFKKILFFCFFISVLAVGSSAGISFYLQTKQLKHEMTERVMAVAGLWSLTLSPADIDAAVKQKTPNNLALNRLVQILSKINERNTTFLGAYILLPEEYPNNRLFILASSDFYQPYLLNSQTFYHSGPEFLKAFNESKHSKNITSSTIYKDKYGTWISAFSPIRNNRGEVVAVLGIDVDASEIKRSQLNILSIVILGMMFYILFVYIILTWGIKRVLKPVDDVFLGLKEISTGNFNVKLPIRDQSELGLLSERFNEMSLRLSLLFEKVSKASMHLNLQTNDENDKLLLDEAIVRMDDIFHKTKLQQELQRAEKMNAIGQLAASVAHEIRNPMTVVKGFLQIFLSKELEKEEKLYIKLMLEELNRAETIINDYLNLAKPDIGCLEPIDASEIGEKATELISSYAMMSKNIMVNVNLEPRVKIRGNKNELKQVLINILKNGVEAMVEGGTLTLNLEKRGKYGVFTIKDEGIGMTEDELSRLGTAFYSLKERGTGIGLMVCYQIIERMKGKIKVTSTKNIGTTFEIHLPLFDESIDEC